MSEIAFHRGLHRFAVATAIATLGLIGIGGLVTSKGAGMAVPDWPTTYGYNMFLFPISMWKGGIFYEHTHRLYAMFVGLLTVVLAVWIACVETRRRMKWFGFGLVFLVALQGTLGGLRVTLFKDQIGIVHATLAQIFLVCMSALALATSRWWVRGESVREAARVPRGLVIAFGAVSFVMLTQLVLGASMRHQHAGLAIPDFPLAYGKLWPATDPDSILRYNQSRQEITALNPITFTHIVHHMTHRITALILYVSVAVCAWRAKRLVGPRHPLTRAAGVWFAILNLQLLLGAATVWSAKAADVATAHVVTGAVALVTGSLITIVARRMQVAPALPESRGEIPSENSRRAKTISAAPQSAR